MKLENLIILKHVQDLEQRKKKDNIMSAGSKEKFCRVVFLFGVRFFFRVSQCFFFLNEVSSED